MGILEWDIIGGCMIENDTENGIDPVSTTATLYRKFVEAQSEIDPHHKFKARISVDFDCGPNGECYRAYISNGVDEKLVYIDTVHFTENQLPTIKIIGLPFHLFDPNRIKAECDRLVDWATRRCVHNNRLLPEGVSLHTFVSTVRYIKLTAFLP